MFLAVAAAAIYALGSTAGLVGAAGGVMGAYMARVLLATTLAQRAYPLPWRFAPVVGLTAVTCVAGLGAEMAAAGGTPALRSLAAVAGIVVLWLVGWYTLEAGERRRLFAHVAARLRSA